MSIDEYGAKLKTMTRDELEEELEIIQESLEDIQIEKRLILGQTGVHISAGKVESFRNSFDHEISTLEKRINLVKEVLGSRKT